MGLQDRFREAGGGTGSVMDVADRFGGDEGWRGVRSVGEDFSEGEFRKGEGGDEALGCGEGGGGKALRVEEEFGGGGFEEVADCFGVALRPVGEV